MVQSALAEIFARIGESLGIARNKYQVRGSGTYLATFTPMQFDVRDGKVTTTQMWMTSADMAVGFDTRADLVNDRLDMMMGMVGGTLSAGLPVIRPAIDVAAIYDIPVRGDLSNPQPDYIPLTTGIIANSAGNVGGLIGGLFGKSKVGEDRQDHRRGGRCRDQDDARRQQPRLEASRCRRRVRRSPGRRPPEDRSHLRAQGTTQAKARQQPFEGPLWPLTPGSLCSGRVDSSVDGDCRARNLARYTGVDRV